MAAKKHRYTIAYQSDGRFGALIAGGPVSTILDCPTKQAAIESAKWAIAQNKEYEADAA